jgi:hypothetical protein
MTCPARNTNFAFDDVVIDEVARAWHRESSQSAAHQSTGFRVALYYSECALHSLHYKHSSVDILSGNVFQ